MCIVSEDALSSSLILSRSAAAVEGCADVPLLLFDALPLGYVKSPVSVMAGEGLLLLLGRPGARAAAGAPQSGGGETGGGVGGARGGHSCKKIKCLH